MSRICKLAPELVDLVGDMRERGRSSQQIVNRLASKGVLVNTNYVDWLCLTRGFDLPATRARPTAGPRAGKAYVRCGREVRPFSQDEDSALRTLDSSGLRVSKIARQLGRSHNSVRNRLATLARHEGRRESLGEMAHG